MIRLNVFFRLEKEENCKAFTEAAKELVELSVKDNGCVAYDVFESLTKPKNLMICETWKTREDLDAHMASEHFKRIVPQLQQLAEMKLEEFTF